MSTLTQLIKKPRMKKLHTNNVQALKGCPQKKGMVIKVRIAKPKKPNSAQRKITKLRLAKSRKILAYIPGQGHSLREYSNVWVSGGRVNDLPGVRYSIMRGKGDLSWKENFIRTAKRSKYGIPKN